MNRARWLVALVFAVTSVIFAYWWGDYLMGAEGGVLYAVQAACEAWLVIWVLVLTKRPSMWRDVAVAALSLRILVGLVFPSVFQPACEWSICQHSTERTVRSELAAVLSSDPTHRDVSISVTHLRVINVTVAGTLAGRTDFDQLRRRVNSECPTLKQGYLHWDVHVRESREQFVGYDRDFSSTNR